MIGLDLVPQLIRQFVFTCDMRYRVRCYRQIASHADMVPRSKRKEWEEESGDWIIWLTDEGQLIVRCPRHISKRTMEHTVRRTNEKLAHYEAGKQRDLERDISPALSPIIDIRGLLYEGEAIDGDE